MFHNHYVSEVEHLWYTCLMDHYTSSLLVLLLVFFFFSTKMFMVDLVNIIQTLLTVLPSMASSTLLPQSVKQNLHLSLGRQKWDRGNLLVTLAVFFWKARMWRWFGLKWFSNAPSLCCGVTRWQCQSVDQNLCSMSITGWCVSRHTCGYHNSGLLIIASQRVNRR